MIDISKLPPQVLLRLRNSELSLNHIESNSPECIFSEWLEYQGIIGYAAGIIETLDALRSSEVHLTKPLHA